LPPSSALWSADPQRLVCFAWPPVFTMNTDFVQVASVEVQAGNAHASGTDSLVRVSPSLLILSWVAFGVLAAILSRLAWKPVMAAIEAREEAAKRAAQEAERIARQKKEWEEAREKRMMEAQRAAEEIISRAKEKAVEAGAEIENAARRKADKMILEARMEIERATAEARTRLRREGAAVAAELAAALLAERMDGRTSEEITRRLAKDI